MDSKLYYGDNLAVLRESVRDESVNMIYLDPPFNSKAAYNVLFKTPTGEAAEAQAEAFLDTWTWGPSADAAYEDVMSAGGSAARILGALYSAFGKTDMLAYLTMMAARLEEMYRALKPTGSLFLHCDPTAAHYLKIILDGIFGPECFRNEIVWKRTHAHGSAKRFGPVHDTILFFGKGPKTTWNDILLPHDPSYIDKHFKMIDEKTGKNFSPITLTGAGIRHGESGRPWNGINPTASGRHWALPKHILDRIGVEEGGSVQEKLDALDKAGRIYWPAKKDGKPRLKWFADELEGVSLSDIWTDIDPISSHAQERLGYPTQKPLALLDRIIASASNEGDVVLDPFCGCGTAVHAAQRLNRKWIGIDITHYAISLIEARMHKAFPRISVPVEGRPEDYEAACDLAARNKYQFQWWVNWLLGVQNYRERKKGADRGIDGTIYFPNGPKGVGRIIVSVKAGENLGVSMLRDLHGTMAREEAELGVMVTASEPTQAMKQEARQSGIVRTAPGTYPKVQLLWIKDWFDGRRPQLPHAFEPEKLRLAGRPERRDQRQFGFTFSIPGGAKKGEVVHTDPRTAFALLDRA